jgi:outer membrane protein assembly factor BamB
MTAHWKKSVPVGSAILAALCFHALAHGVQAQEWTSFRGPTDQGHAEAPSLPLKWSEAENVSWKTEVPGKAWSSPVIWGDRIWLADATEDGTQLSALAVDKNTGAVLIRKRLRRVNAPQYCHPFNSYASPSPVIEERRVYVSFGSPYTACLDSTTGDVVWERTDFVCNHFRGAGSSPFLYKNLLILHFDGSDQQYVVAMDKSTGKTVWRTPRSVDFRDLDAATGGPQLDGDLRKAYSTPIIASVAGKDVLISLGSMAIYGYEPETGKEIWRVEAIGSHSGSSRPVLGHGLVYVPMGMGRDVFAIRPDGKGVVTETHVAWRLKRIAPSRSSMLLAGERLFLVNDDGVAACVAARSGQELWRERMGGNFSASPVYAQGRVYFFDEAGKTTVIEDSNRYRVLAVNQLAAGFMASPAVSGNALYLRTRTHLYRIETGGRRATSGRQP